MRNWLKRGSSKLQSRRRSAGPNSRRRVSSRGSQGLEPLENRCLLAVTATLNGTVLEISSDAADDVAIAAVGGNVQVEVNGGGFMDPTGGPLAANLLTAIDVSGYTGVFSNTLDLMGVTPGDFTSLQTIFADMGADFDQVFLGSAVTTTGNQTYVDHVVIQSNTDIDAGMGQVTFGDTISGPFNLIISSASTTIFSDDVNVAAAGTNSPDVRVEPALSGDVSLQMLGGISYLEINGTTLVALPALDTFTFEGGAGDDALSILGANGNPVPAGGVTFNGNGQTSTDRLFVGGDMTNTAVYTPDTATAGDGVVTLDGNAITFTGLEPVDITGMAIASVVTPNAVNQLTVSDGFDFATGLVPAMLVAGTSGGVAIETAALWNNALVNVDTSTIGGPDSVSVDSPTATHNNGLLVVMTGDGTDQLTVDSTAIPTRLLGGNDNDVFTVTPSLTAEITVNGQPPVVGDPGVPPGDILALNLQGVTGALVPPVGATSGVVTSTSHQDVIFTSIETLIASDRFELNNTLETATVLGSEPEVTLRNLSIHDQDDVDFFKITANKTGKLIINAFFTDAIGDLDMQLLDGNGNVVASSSSTTDDEQIIVPVVSQEMYFLNVFGFNGAVNNYELEIENFAAPVPGAAFLDPASDTGMMSNDNITNDDTPQFYVLADLTNFANMGITILDAAQAAAGQTAGAAVRVFATNLSTGITVEGYADPVGASTTLFAFTPAALADGTYFINAAVDIFDLQQDGGGLPDPAMGRSQLSQQLTVTIDSTPPDPSTVPDLLASSDSGVFDDDDVTNIFAPAFDGVGPANHKIRILAARNGGPFVTIGQGVIGSDLTDDPTPNGLGAWEVTVEPLTNGTYEVVAIVEDFAGNQSTATEALTVYIDTIEPNTPVLDLDAASDSGRNDTDNITNDNTPTVITTADDPFVVGTNPFPNDILYRIFDRLSPNEEVLLVDSFTNLGGLTTLGVFTDVLPLLDDGVHNLKLEVEDRAGNLSHDFLLTVVIDTVAPPTPMITLDPASDTGIPGQPETFVDFITSKSAPAFLGLAEANSLVRVYGDGDPLSEFAIDGSDTFLGETVAIPLDGNQVLADGEWLLTKLLVDLNNPAFFPFDGLRQIGATAEDVAGNVSDGGAVIGSGFIDIFLDTQAPKVESVGLTDFPGYDLFDPKPSEDGPTPPVTSIDIGFIDYPIRGLEGMQASGTLDIIVVVDESGSMSGEQMFLGDFIPDLEAGLIAAGVGTVAGANRYGLVGFGSGTVDARSFMVGAGAFGSAAQFTAATASLLTDGGTEDGYDGIDLALDGSVYGLRAEADTLIILVTDEDRDNTDITLTFASVLADLNTNDATLHAILDVDLRDQADNPALALSFDGISFVADGSGGFISGPGGTVAGGSGTTVDDYVNLSFATQGIVSDLNQLRLGGDTATSFSNALLQSLVSSVTAGFLYPAVNEQLASTIGNYELVGDHNGVIPIAGVEYIDNTVSGGPGLTTVRLLFDEPLPDDRFTLRIRDSIRDEPGNALDGESGANAPHDNPVLPSGDGAPGGDFVARFTVDSRPEIATFSDGSVYVDSNGNYYFDTTNHDFSNRDLVFEYGFATDYLFAGNFNQQGMAADGFDKLGAYGFVNGAWRWILDTDNDGVANLNLVNPLAIDGLPIAGNFNGFTIDGDEVGLFDGHTWYLDTNANDVIDAFDVQLPNSNMTGYPIAGDFDGDGIDDLGTFANNVFQFDLAFDGLDGQFDDTISWGFSGVLERPVAGDLNLDGIDDIGLWVPGRSGQLPQRAAEWYFLLSTVPTDVFPAEAAIIAPNYGTVNYLDHPFSPQPLGNDLFAQYGDEFGLPLFGNFDPPPTGLSNGSGPMQSTVGLFNPSTASVYLRSANSSGVPDAGLYNYGQPGWIAVSGDFNGDGIETVGVYNPATATFFLSNSNATGVADMPPINYGMPGWTPIVGDWNGDGIDTIGVYNPATATFFLRNSNSTGVADVPAINYGMPGWSPIVGDWDGNGIDTLGVYNTATATFFLRNSNTTGVADVPAFNYGAAGWTPLAGDWNSDGVDTIGVYNGSTSTFFLRNANSSGAADIPAFNYGPAGGGWQPLIGDWNGPSGSPLRLNGAAVLDSDAAELSAAALYPAVAQAIANWTTVGLSSSQASTLAGIEFRITDLPGNYLGLALDDVIYLDSDAAGLGWHLDPGDDSVVGVDLLSVVAHELGHSLGLEDLGVAHHHDELMTATLAAGERRLPGADDLLFGSDDWL